MCIIDRMCFISCFKGGDNIVVEMGRYIPQFTKEIWSYNTNQERRKQFQVNL